MNGAPVYGGDDWGRAFPREEADPVTRDEPNVTLPALNGEGLACITLHVAAADMLRGRQKTQPATTEVDAASSKERGALRVVCCACRTPSAAPFGRYIDSETRGNAGVIPTAASISPEPAHEPPIANFVGSTYARHQTMRIPTASERLRQR